MLTHFLSGVSLVGFILSLDQYVKTWISGKYIPGMREYLVPPIPLYIEAINYKGIIAGTMGLQPEMELGLQVVLPLLGFLTLLILVRKSGDNLWLGNFGLSFVIAGAFGNLIDKIQYGYVVHCFSLAVQEKPTLISFNVADIAVFLGVIMVTLAIFRQWQPSLKSV